MPTESQIIELQNELNDIAAAIRAQVNLIGAKTTAILNKMETLENLKGGLLNAVLNARFEINNKLMYTNDDQRRLALNRLKSDDTAYRTAQNELWTLEEQRRQAEAEAEFQRKKHRAAELVMQFYANSKLNE